MIVSLILAILCVWLGFEIALFRFHLIMHTKWSNKKLRNYGLDPRERKHYSKWITRLFFV